MYFLSIATCLEASWSFQCLIGTSRHRWGIVFWCLTVSIMKSNGDNLLPSEKMKVEPPIQLFFFMLNRHWFQFVEKHFVHEHNFFQQPLKIDCYANYRVFTITQMTCQVCFSLMFTFLGKGLILGGEKRIFIDQWSVFQRNKNIYFHLSFLDCGILYYELFLGTTGICM